MAMYLLLDVFIAFALDFFIGYPRWMPHPVKFIKWLGKKIENMMRSIINASSAKKVKALGEDVVRNTRRSYRNERAVGAAFILIMIGIVIIIVAGVLKLSMFVNPILFHVINTYLIYSSFASRAVATEGYKVFDALKERDIFKARNMLAAAVGRKTENLDEKEIIKGSVESTAENTSDRVIAPIFYAFLASFFGLGATIVYVYKTINTLDQVVGYKNEMYKNFGWATAKLDDIVNYIPARLTGLLIVLGALITRKEYKSSYSIMMRDRKKHVSPNSGYPEAAVAGALGIRLGAEALYFGDIVEKPTIGDDVNELDIKAISQTITLMYAASIIAMLLMGSLGLLIIALAEYVF
ncbi:adenosylcobinamide-phosphate synthase CbiB [Acetivibrio mesophilus]|uniref:Cobalamin biosynthesis protein CobD n=1 Tax=Acetivibrio mesophilus TaxID=2487273 RepID=A0A4Q0I2B1_9FIRM|nr:adenosylcobinamide-phosphate synthase CbiB [Acetivibrio mesophilus]ODM27949.1 cobalamin biosynthesis protein CobD [Clostridium sp. Bc-iso-3]RXE58384.1 cobalamin biosynthesis protein CobD [Acetivibrio mesophilus]HHV28851.1 cobalamin biosynthesis protein CobD [Clostridium sp.]